MMIGDLIQGIVIGRGCFQYLSAREWLILILGLAAFNALMHAMLPHLVFLQLLLYVYAVILGNLLILGIAVGSVGAAIGAIHREFIKVKAISRLNGTSWPYPRQKHWYFRDWRVDAENGSWRVLTLASDVKERVLENAA